MTFQKISKVDFERSSEKWVSATEGVPRKHGFSLSLYSLDHGEHEFVQQFFLPSHPHAAHPRYKMGQSVMN